MRNPGGLYYCKRFYLLYNKVFEIFPQVEEKSVPQLGEILTPLHSVSCFVVLDDIVGRCNPNQNLRTLESLLDSSVDWKANLMNILSYVYFDDEPREKATKMKYNNSLSRTHDYTGQTVNSEDFA